MPLGSLPGHCAISPNPILQIPVEDVVSRVGPRRWEACAWAGLSVREGQYRSELFDRRSRAPETVRGLGKLGGGLPGMFDRPRCARPLLGRATSGLDHEFVFSLREEIGAGEYVSAHWLSVLLVSGELFVEGQSFRRLACLALLGCKFRLIDFGGLLFQLLQLLRYILVNQGHLLHALTLTHALIPLPDAHVAHRRTGERLPRHHMPCSAIRLLMQRFALLLNFSFMRL